MPVPASWEPSSWKPSRIPRSVRLSEAPSHGRSILDYNPASRGARAYRALADEVLAQEGAGR